MRQFPVRLLSALAAAALALMLALNPAAAGLAAPDQTPTAAPSDQERAGQSAAWLIGQLDPDGTMPGPGTPQDWGLTVDVLFALHSAGVGHGAAEGIIDALEANVAAYAGPAWWPEPGTRLAGPTAKLLLAAVVAGAHPGHFGGRDLRAETLALLHDDPVDAEHGRVKDNIVGHPGTDDSNTFSQSLAVIGLARTGGVPQQAVDFLLKQQCVEGYFRMFANDRTTNPALTCDGGKAAGMSGADNDGTAMAVQALMSARDHGVSGLDDKIDRALDYLASAQRADGSFGGGVSTEGSNANSTALVTVVLEAGGRDAAAQAAKAYVRGLHVDAEIATGTPMADAVGAVAYDPETLTVGLGTGLGVAVDQWRRTTAQAALAFAATPLGDLGRRPLAPNPTPVPAPEPSDPPSSSPTAPPSSPEPTSSPHGPTPSPSASAPASPPTGSARSAPLPTRPAPGSPPDRGTALRSSPAGGPAPTGPVDDTASETTTPSRTTTPDAAGAAIAYLLDQLVDGTHLRTEVDGTVYVDHAETARAALALLAAQAPPEQVQPVVDQLLTGQAVREHAHGQPYDADDAAYVEPLATLVLLAAATGADPHDVGGEDLVADLLATQASDGWFHDISDVGDTSDTESQARAVLALTAAGEPQAAERGKQRLLHTQCTDGLFPATDPSPTGCDQGDPRVTGLALQARNARAGDGPSTATAPSGVAPSPTSSALTGLLAAQQEARWSGEDGPVATTGEAASGLIAAGAPADDAITWLTELTTAEGGLPSAPGGPTDRAATISALPALARSSYLTIPHGPLAPAGTLQPVATPSPTEERAMITAAPALTTPPADATDRSLWAWLLLLAVPVGIGAFWWRSRQATPAPAHSTSAAGQETTRG